METFEFRFSLAVVAWILNLLAVGVSVEAFQTHVDADQAARFHMFTLPLGLDTELDIMPICAS